MRMHPQRVCVIIAATVVLHNIRVLRRLPVPRQVDVAGLDEVENPVGPHQVDDLFATT